MMRSNIKIEKKRLCIAASFFNFPIWGDADQLLKILPNLAMKKQT
jgi:hypothetical protein